MEIAPLDETTFVLLLLDSVVRDDLSFRFPFTTAACGSESGGVSTFTGVVGRSDCAGSFAGAASSAGVGCGGGPGEGGAFRLSLALRCVDHKP